MGYIRQWKVKEGRVEEKNGGMGETEKERRRVGDDRRY
jgi:hypothetical protein